MVESWPVTWPAWLGELALAGVCVAVPIVELFVHASTGSDSTDTLIIVLMVIGAAALLLRHRHPVLVTVVCGSCTVAVAAAGDRSPLISSSLAVALYSVGVAGLRLRTVITVTLAACAAFVTGLLFTSDRTLSIHDLVHAAAMAAPVAGGRLVAMQRVTTALRIERVELAIRAERDLQQLRIEQERRRIARDLHDAVGHALTTITVQSGVAARLLDTRPAFAREALLEISAAGGEALRDLRSVVGMLRRSDTNTADGSCLPVEGLPVEG
ncbi:MAG: hypothetical protein QG671_3613, partial [Actinomycetota bacterium]|nr:hypothetical protein [Actinomycetota bacterium]